MLTLPVLLVSMDMTVLHLAIPAITTALAPSGTQMLWIVDIYAFMVAGLLITMGAVGDRIGRRRLLLLGAVAFALASVTAAFATSPGMLITARAALGVAGATLAPSTLALIRTMFSDPRQRSTATSVWVLAFLTGASIGPVVGGLLLQHFWWGSVFLLGVPVMAVLLLAGPALLPEYRAPTSAAVDFPSAALSLAAVLAVVYGLKEAAAGAGFLTSALAVGAGGLLAVVFAHRQRRLPRPLLDLSLFKERSFSVAIGVLTLGSVVLAGVGFLIAQYLQLVLGLSPLAAGLWTLPPLTAGIAAVILVQALGQRLTVAATTTAGLVVAASGLTLLTQAPTTGVVIVVTGLALLFAGLMPVLAQGVDTVTGSAPPDRAGAASALSETTQELGGALGIAVLGSIAAAVYRIQASDLLQGIPTPAAGAARELWPEPSAPPATSPPGCSQVPRSHSPTAYTPLLRPERSSSPWPPPWPPLSCAHDHSPTHTICTARGDCRRSRPVLPLTDRLRDVGVLVAIGCQGRMPPASAGSTAYRHPVSWATYGSFLAFALVLIVVPGPDFAVVTKNTLAAGRRRGVWSAVGVASSNAAQGIAAAAGLGAVIVRSQPLFEAIRWAGIAYLTFLGVQAIRSATIGRYTAFDAAREAAPKEGLAGWRQGFLSNVTNPKVLVFYLAVLPQFLDRDAHVGVLVLFALSHAVLSLAYLLMLVTGLHRARRVLSRRRVRRTLDAVTGTALLGFGARLAVERT